MKIEFRIPISPNPSFYSQVLLFVLSLKRLGPPYDTAKIQISVGDCAVKDEVLSQNSWANSYPVCWTVVPHDICNNKKLSASGRWRYAHESDADVIILSDADTCLIARFDDLLNQLNSDKPKIAGLQAHVAPFPPTVHDSKWRVLLKAIGKSEKPLTKVYSMDVQGTHGFAPPYFNYGFVAFNAHAFRHASSNIEQYLDLCSDLLEGNVFFAQIALTLFIVGCNIEPIMLGHEYNCANDDRLTRHQLVNLSDIRIIHYLRKNEFDRHDFLCDREKYDAFIGEEKQNAITEKFRQHVKKIPELFKEWK